jgi:hypothetical protein
MAQIGNEVVDRPSPGQPIDEQAAKHIEIQEEVKSQEISLPQIQLIS